MNKRKKQERPASRVAFTDGNAVAPPTMAVDARAQAGETRRAMRQLGQEAIFNPSGNPKEPTPR